MMRSIFNSVTMVSTVMLALTVLLFVTGYVIGPWSPTLSLRHDFHLRVWNRGPNSRLVFFNDAEYGAYCGSIIGLVDADGVDRSLEREEWFDAWGIYYRFFQWPDYKLWTLMVTLWYPIVLFAFAPGLRLLYLTWNRRDLHRMTD
jgi:hypothetical protein